eukprot:3568124-Rhodomonas_salina.1
MPHNLAFEARMSGDQPSSSVALRSAPSSWSLHSSAVSPLAAYYLSTQNKRTCRYRAHLPAASSITFIAPSDALFASVAISVVTAK